MKRMKIMYDTEFLQLGGRQFDLISIGMVREDGQEFYAVSTEFDTVAVAREPWLMENVMTTIGHEEYTSWITGTGQPIKDLFITDPAGMSKRLIRDRIIEFTSDIIPEWWAWQGSVDHVLLYGLFGDFSTQPSGWPYSTLDINQPWQAKGRPALPVMETGLHNALDDARACWDKYRFLESYDPEAGLAPSLVTVLD
jgi:hypothetical protein